MPDPTTPDPRTEIVGVRTALMERAARLHEMLEQPTANRSETWGLEMRAARDEILGLDARFTALQRSVEPEPIVGQGPTAANHNVSARETRSLGQQVVESDDYRAWTNDGTTRRPAGSVEVRTTITSVADSGFTSGGSMLPIMPYALAAQAIRRDRLVVRDLLPQTTTIYEVIHFVGETYVSGAGDAAMVAEGALKPEVAMNWYRQDTNVKKVAAWVPATLESLTDVGQLRGAIDNRLQYKIARQEEFQLLQGDGTGQNLLGLLNVPNIQTQAFTTNAFTSFALGRAQIENHDGDATGAVMNPIDYWNAMAASASTLLGASPFSGPPDTLWGLPVVRTPRMTVGHALVGDFAQAAEIFDREDVTIRVGDQHSDYFVRNLVAILAERRETLVTYRGDLFTNVAVA